MIDDPERFEAETAALREDMQRRREALKSLRYSQPTITERDDVATNSAEAAAVRQFVQAGNAADAAASSWVAWVDGRISEERRFVLEVVGEAIGTIVQDERAAVTVEFNAKLAELKLGLVNQMINTLDSIRKTAGISEPIDLPKWPKPGGTAVN
jgi:hypothetical protein